MEARQSLAAEIVEWLRDHFQIPFQHVLPFFLRNDMHTVSPYPKLGAFWDFFQGKHALVAFAILRRIFDLDAADKG